MSAHRTAFTITAFCLILFTHASFAVDDSDNPVMKNFTLREADGDDVFHLSDARGSYVALHFLLQTDCSNCMRLTRDYVARAEEVPDVVHVFIKPDTVEEIKGWTVKMTNIFNENEIAKEAGLPAIYRDAGASLARSLGIPHGYEFHGEVVHYPATVIVGPDGMEVFRYVGETTGDRLLFEQFAVKMKGLKRKAR